MENGRKEEQRERERENGVKRREGEKGGHEEEEIRDATRDWKGRKGRGGGFSLGLGAVGARGGGGKETEGAKGVKKTGRGERSGKGDERYRGEKEGLDARERYRVKAADPSALVQEAAAAREETSRPASVSGMLGAAIVILPPFHRAPITQSISLGCCPSVRPSLPFLSD